MSTAKKPVRSTFFKILRMLLIIGAFLKKKLEQYVKYEAKVMLDISL